MSKITRLSKIKDLAPLEASLVFEKVRNDEGSTIPVGTPVYSKGEIGASGRIKVGIADASDSSKMPAIGITNSELSTSGDGQDGTVTLMGVYNTNLSGFSGVSENDIVYVDIGGGLTITKPTGANLIQNVGIVLKTNGTIIQGLQVTCIGRTNDTPNVIKFRDESGVDNTSIQYDDIDISTWQRKYDRFSVASEETTPEGIFFKTDGTKMYVIGRSGDDIDEYALSTAWDITTASYTDQLSGLNSSPASESNPTGIYMSPDGIYLYITGHSVDQIIQYTMSVAWDVSTATYTREQNLTYNSGSQFTNPDGIDFKSDGTMLFAISRDRDLIQSYNLSTAWDISTISEHQSFSLIDFFDYNVMAKPSGTSDISSAYDMRISQDGTKIWIVDSSYDSVSQLNLSTAFDVTTSVYSGETSRITPYESLISGLYVAESVNKAFSISHSNDYVRTFNFGAATFSTTNNASPSFLTGLGVKGDLKVSQGIINAAGLINTSSTYLYSTLETHGTSNLGHNNGGRVRLVNNNTYSYDSIIDMMTNLKWGSNSNSQSTQDDLNHSINIGKPFSGTKLTVNIGRSMVSDGTFRYHSGLVNIYSDAQFIDHKGRLKVGQNLQVDGVSFEQLEAYDLGGTIIFNDTFTESSDTNLDSHTPDTGAGWTLAYNTTSRTSQVKGGQGHLRMSGDDSSDGIFYLCDTLPTAQDYEVKVDWSRQDNSNDTLSIIIKYKDSNNFLALQWSGSYDYCRLTKIQGGALSNIDPNTTNPFRYGVPTTTTDGQTGSIKLRFIDGKMMVWNIDPEGTISFRGSWDVDSNFHDNDGDGGTFYKFGLGFGEIFSTQGFDATNVWKITNFQVKQLSAASTFNAAQKHYINNGNFGVGITNPTSKFHVVGDARIQGNLTVNGTYTQIDTDVTTTEQWLVTNDGTGPAAVINQLGSQDIFDVQDDGTSVFYIEDGGQIGIGTTSPGAKLHTIPSGSIGWSSLGNAGILIGTDTGAGIGIDQNEIASKGDHLYLGTVTADKDLILRAGGATNRLVVKGNTGNVGIGTTSPSEKLEIDGDIKIQNGDSIKSENVAGSTRTLLSLGTDNVLRIKGNDNEGSSNVISMVNGGNVGIGTTSPVHKLDLKTNPAIGFYHSDGTYQGLIGDGASAVSGGGTYDIGFRANASGNLLFAAGGSTERMRIDTSGNVGIGTTSPSEKLEVSGKGLFESIDIFKVDATANPRLRIGRYNAETLNFDVDDSIARIYHLQDELSATVHQLNITVDSESTAGAKINLGFRDMDGTNESTKFTVLDTGNVGIGTTSPGRKLEVDFTGSVTGAKFTRSDAAGSSLVEFANSAGVKSIIGYDAGLDGYKIGTSSATNLFVKQSGNVGIGTTSPSQGLHVVDSGIITSEFESSDNVSSLIEVSNNAGLDVFFGVYGGNLVLRHDDYTANHFAMDSSGNVGIGQTSPAHKLDVAGYIRSANTGADSTTKYSGFFGRHYTNSEEDVLAISTESTSNNNNIYIGGGFGTRNSATTIRFSTAANNTTTTGSERMRIDSSGNVGIGTTSPNGKLSITNDSTNTYAFRITSSDGGDLGGIYEDGGTNAELYLKNSIGTSNVLINSSGSSYLNGGNVGIGTSSPSEKLEVNGNIKIGDSDFIKIGNGDDLQIYHNATDSWINNANGNLLLVQNANDKDIVFYCDDGSGGVTPYLTLDGSLTRTIANQHLQMVDGKALYVGGSSDAGFYHLSGQNYIENNTGDLNIVQNVDDGDIIFKSDDGAGGVATYLTIDGGLGHTTIDKRLRANDNVDFAVGTGNDLRLVHDGTHSYMTNYTGDFYIANHGDDKDIIFQCDDGSGGLETYFFLDGSYGASPYTIFPDNSTLAFGSNRDLLIVHDATDSKIDNYVGDLKIRNFADDKDIIFQSDDGSGGVTEYFRLDGSVGGGSTVHTVFPDNSKAVFGAGLDTQIYHDGSNSYIKQQGGGDLYIQQTADDKDIVFQSDDGSGGLAAYLTLDGSDEKVKALKQLEVTGGIELTNSNLNMPDNSRIRLGSSTDLQIYHDGSNSFIDDSGTGKLRIRSNALQLEKYTGENMAVFNADGAASIYYDGSKKLETTSTGVEVTGNISLTGSVQKQIQVFPMNFVDDLGTDKHFMPFVTNTEQTVNYQEEAAMVMPADGRVVSVTVHYAQMDGTDGNITVGIETSACGQSYANPWTVEETETIAASVTDDHHVFHFAFDNAKHFESTDKMAISIQQSTDMQSAARFFWVTAVIEYDWSTFLGGTSAEYTTTP